MSTIGVLAAGVLGVFALSMMLPLLVALLEGNFAALEALFLIALGYGFLSVTAILALSPRARPLSRAGVFSAAIVVWISLIAAAVPVFMLVEGKGVIEALFEASSAAVTLGTTLVPPAEIAPSMAFYRGTTAWIGGLMTLTLAVYVLGPYQVGGMPNTNLRRVQHAQTEDDPRILTTLRAITAPYLGLTVLCAVLLIVMRVPADTAVITAMSMISTNGFVPGNTEGTVLANPAAELVMLVFMVLGATSIVWHKLVLARDRTQSRESAEGRLYLTALGVLIALAIAAAIFGSRNEYGMADTAFRYVFDIVSIATTTGISHDRSLGLSIPFEVILIVVFIGGCSYSTAGGIKAYSLLTMLRHVDNELVRLVYPNAMLRDDVQYDEDQRAIAKAVWSAFFLAVLTLTIAIQIFAAQGYELPAAMALATGAFSQVGNVLVSAAPELADGGVSNPTLLTIAILGAVARIEILVLLAALAGNRW